MVSASRPKAYSYLRMSTELQLKGDSRRRQMEASEAYAREHELDLVDEGRLEDIGVSAFTGENVEHGALGRFLKAVKAGSVERGSYLLVESLDRITRQHILPSLTIFLSIIQAGINLVTLQDGRVYTASKTEMVDLVTSLVIMSRAHEESRTKSQRIAAAWKNKRRQATDRPMTAMCPAWLRLSHDRKSYELIEDRAEVVRSIFRDAGSGLGVYVIARRLNEAGVPSFNASDGWHTSYVAKILNNRAAIGEFQPHTKVNGVRSPDGDPISGYFPAVVDEATFFRAQDGKANRRSNGRGRKGVLVTNLFSGLSRCAYCRGSIKYEDKGSGPKGGQYLVCDRARRKLGCINARWRYRDFEASFLAFVRELNLEEIVSASDPASDRARLDDQIAALRGEMGSLDQQLERTYELYAVSGGSVAFVSNKLSELEAKKLDLQARAKEHDSQRQALTASSAVASERQTELRSTIALLQSQSGDEVYRLRAQISSILKQIIADLYVAPVGSAPNVERVLRTLQEEAGEGWSKVAEYLRQSIATEANRSRYFCIGFKNGTVRAVYPDDKDALRYRQQIVSSQGELRRLVAGQSETIVATKVRLKGLTGSAGN